MKHKAVLAVCLIFISGLKISAAEFEDVYGNVADYLNKIYGVDNNAGLTAFPVLNVPIGGRSEGMANAFTAICDDISFIEFNPAGSSMLKKTELAFFHNNWVADSKVESIAFTTRFNNLGIGAAGKWLYLPFTEYNIYGDRVSTGYYSEGVAVLNFSYNLFRGYYFSGVSIGANLKGAFRAMPDFTDNFDNIIAGSGKSQSAIMAMADVGFLTGFNLLKTYSSRDNNFFLAAVFRNLGPPVQGESLPTTFNAAISYRPIRPLVLALDFSLPINMMDVSLSEKPYGAAGLSVNVTNFLSMSTGFMFKPGNSRIAIGSEVKLRNMALDINYTADLLTQFRSLNRVSLAIRMNLGDKGRQNLISRIEELYLLGHEAYLVGNIDDAIDCWLEALRLDPAFDPAKESLEMLKNREGLIERIEDLFRLDF